MPEENRPVSSKAPCPCGSGKKYKRCCGPRDAEALRTQGRRAGWKVALAAVAGVALVTAVIAGVLQLKPEPEPVPVPPPKPPGEAGPAPWTYNPATNQHWDPNHNHWHDGPPPNRAGGTAPNPGPATRPDATPDSAPAVESGSTPEPWTYNPETDKHWNPTHNHWHDGPPPEGAG